ncbi:unnamed protein product [Gordionus sp. m RMFG-2023]|uniref:iron-sulfur cluster assembly 1 homolog, mitochondrial-like n=1 Tax=Gordionus sp. m RMFG-2023 TaxID=3053472 RepID=UPI0030E44C91
MSSGISVTVKAIGSSKFAKRAALILTENAIKRVKQLLLQNQNAIGLRIGVKQKGCSGLAYYLEYTNQKNKLDEEVNQDGVKIYIDRKAQLSLLGTEMDFVSSALSSEFIFNNPNIKGTCGCGESFTM